MSLFMSDIKRMKEFQKCSYTSEEKNSNTQKTQTSTWNQNCTIMLKTANVKNQLGSLLSIYH